jgi:hypothetical protein
VLVIKLACGHNWYELSKSIILRLIGQSTDYLCLIRAGNLTLTKWCYSYVSSTCSVVELKTLFETWIERSDVYGVYWFHFSYLITGLVYLCSQWAPLVQIKYFMFYWSIYKIFVLSKAWKRYSLQVIIFVFLCLLDMQRIWTKNAIWNLNTMKWSKWCIYVSPFLFNNCFGAGY